MTTNRKKSALVINREQYNLIDIPFKNIGHCDVTNEFSLSFIICFE